MDKYEDLIELLDMKIYSEDVLESLLKKAGLKIFRHLSMMKMTGFVIKKKSLIIKTIYHFPNTSKVNIMSRVRTNFANMSWLMFSQIITSVCAFV